MKLKNFEDWFAIRPNHSDEVGHRSGRIIFDINDGISVETISFTSSKDKEEKLVVGQTMTGWIDYQRPATIVQPWVQSVGGFTMSVDTPAMRQSYRYVAAGILKNIFLEDINQAVFVGLTVEHPAFHAWVNPNLVKSDWLTSHEAGSSRLSIDIKPDRHREFMLTNGIRAEVFSATRSPSGEATTLEEYTTLSLRFTEPKNYDDITRLKWRISSLFEFLIGARVQSPVYQLATTHTREWNGQKREIVAELLYHPISRKSRKDVIPHEYYCLTVERRCPIPIEKLLDHVIGESDKLIYLADLIQSAEDHDIQITQSFGEVLGCLEAFDDRNFGSGAEENFKPRLQALSKIVADHATEDQKVLFERIKGGAHNKFSLLKRLERLHKFWADDGFRGSPDLSKIRDLRNIVPHGRGLEVSSDVAQQMAAYLRYLTALGRYHVLRSLGFTGEQVAAAFSWQATRYGMFVPRHPSDEATAEESAH